MSQMSNLDLLIWEKTKDKVSYLSLRKEIDSHFRDSKRYPLKSLSRKAQKIFRDYLIYHNKRRKND